MLRITRHPLFIGLVFIGIGHTLLNGFATDVAFFGGLALYSVIGALSQDARKRVLEMERLASFYEQTSVLPFVAILTGRTKLVLSEMPWLGLAIGAAAAWLFHRLHPWLWS